MQRPGIACLRGLLLVTAVGLSVGWARQAAANIGPPEDFRLGRLVGEPSGLKQVVIEREELRIDLRPLERGQPVPIEAAYEVRRPGEVGEQTLDLVFVGGRMAQQPAEVLLDGVAVPSERVRLDRVPAGWLPEEGGRPRYARDPSARPGRGPEGDSEAHFEGVRFQLTLTSGQHRITVRYLATATAASRQDETRITWIVRYVLAPARSWAGFGRLQVWVEAPPGWQVESTPELSFQPPRWGATFSGLPADVLVIRCQSPPRYPAIASWMRAWGGPALIGIGGLLSCGGALLFGRWLARRGQSPVWTILCGPAVGGLWLLGTPFAAHLFLQTQVMLEAAPYQESWYFGQNTAYGLLFLAVGLALAGLLGGQLTALLSALYFRRRAAR